MTTSYKKLVLAASIAALTSACSGSNTQTSNTAPTTTSAETPAVASSSAAPTVSRLAIGEIDGFGSVIVNGVHYDTDKAEIIVDGEIASEDALDVGMLVEVDAEETAEDGAKDKSPEAKQIRFYSKLVGEIEGIDAQAQTLTVMGQTVIINDETLLDETINELSLAPLDQGTFVRVSGRTQENGEVVASRIDIREKQDRTFFSGLIESIDDNTGLISVDGQTVDSSNANIRGELATGLRIFVRGVMSDSVLQADRIAVISRMPESQGSTNKDTKEIIDIKGEIKRTDDGFTMGDYPLIDLQDDMIQNGELDDIEGELVNITGELSDNGEIIVNSAEIQLPVTLIIKGEVEEINSDTSNLVTDISAAPAGSTAIKVNGEYYFAKDDTDFIDRASDERFFNVADIRIGDKLVIDAYFNKQEQRIAKSIMRIDNDNQTQGLSAKLFVTVENIDEKGLIISTDGTRISITENTFLDEGIDFNNVQFGVDGDQFIVHGFYDDNQVLQATFVGIEHDDIDDFMDDFPSEQFTKEGIIEQHRAAIERAEAAIARAKENTQFSEATRNRIVRALERIVEGHNDIINKLLGDTPIKQPIDDIPQEETPVEEIPAEEVPAEETPEEEAPANEENPSEKDPEQDPATPTEEIPSDESEETPVEEQPEEENVSEEDMPSKETPIEEIPEKEYPADNSPIKELPSDEVPTEEWPGKEYPETPWPADHIPSDSTPVKEYPSEKFPVKDFPSEEFPIKEFPSDQNSDNSQEDSNNEAPIDLIESEGEGEKILKRIDHVEALIASNLKFIAKSEIELEAIKQNENASDFELHRATLLEKFIKIALDDNKKFKEEITQLQAQL